MSWHSEMESVRTAIASCSAKGMMCAAPGCRETTNLHVDHKQDSRNWACENHGWDRPRMYRRDLANGEVLQLLCRKHNLRKAQRSKANGLRKNYHNENGKCFAQCCRPRSSR